MTPAGGIAFHLAGADRGSDRVRAGDLVAFIQRLLATLSAIDLAINGRQTRFYRIAQFAAASASITLEETVDDHARARGGPSRDVESALGELLHAVEQVSVPAWADAEVLVKLRELTDPLTHLRYAELATGVERHALDDTFRAKVERAIGHDTVTTGDLVGTIEALNFHNRYRATLYSTRNDPVACEFAPALREKVVGALNRRVRVHGELTRRANSDWPYHVQVLDVEPLPDEADLPLFADLYGTSRSFPKDIDPVEYVRALRDADE